MVIELGFAVVLIGLVIAGIIVLYRFSRRNKPDPKFLWLNSLLSLVVHHRILRWNVREAHYR